jgi:hypothetical protein
MKKLTVTLTFSIIVILSITSLDMYAISQGINGIAMSTTMTVIGGVSTIAIQSIWKNKNE